MSSKGVVIASITELERAVGSRESKKNFEKGIFQNKMYYKSLSFLNGNQVRLKFVWIHEFTNPEENMQRRQKTQFVGSQMREPNKNDI